MAGIESVKTALAARYDVEREIGAGGMATVFLARDLKHGRDVAIKVLRAEVSDRMSSDRFLREIRLTAGLDHPNILALLDSGETDGLSYYVLPFVRGESLRAKLDREGRLDVDEAVRIAREVAAALHYAHGRGIIHRDVKPENILLGDGRARLADFGIAFMHDSAETRLTLTGISLGTPYYMSPEQAGGERSLDARSDVFSLGAVVYEMVTGEPPFSGASAQAVVARILLENPVPPRMLRPSLSEDLSVAILTALAREPSERFATADAFGRALETAVSGALPTYSTAGERRRRMSSLMRVTAVVAAVAVVAVVARQVSNHSSARQVADSVRAPQRAAVGADTSMSPTTVVVPLHHRRAAELQPIVAISLSSGAHVVADTTMNALVINELPRLIGERVRLVRQLDSVGRSGRVGPPPAATTPRGDSASQAGQTTKLATDPLPPPNGKLRVALVSFTNGSVGRSGSDLAPLRLAITDLLMSDLMTAPELEVVDLPSGPGSVEITDIPSAVAAGRRVGASAIIVGNYIGDATGRLRLSARMVDVKSAAVKRNEVIDGRQDSVFAPISTLSRRLRCALDTIAMRRPACDGPAQPTRTELKAQAVKLDISTMRKYSSALDAMDSRDYPTAIRMFNEIARAYPDFAPARQRLDKIADLLAAKPER